MNNNNNNQEEENKQQNNNEINNELLEISSKPSIIRSKSLGLLLNATTNFVDNVIQSSKSSTLLRLFSRQSSKVSCTDEET